MSAPSWDSTPHMQAAGYIPAVEGEAATAENTLKPEFFSQAPPTPEYMRKWRKDTSPGKTCLHPGVADDTSHHNVAVYGRVELEHSETRAEDGQEMSSAAKSSSPCVVRNHVPSP